MASSTLSDQAAELAAQHGITVPLDSQPRLFLESVWRAIPAGQLVGLVAEDEYWDKARRSWQDVATPKWTFWPNDLDSMIEWARAKNSGTRYQLSGRGGIFWHAASRKNTVL